MRLAILSIVIALGLGLAVIPNALASHGTDTASCEGDGLYDGKNNPFSQELYDMCGDTYYDAFIEGCMSVGGNTRDVCENATDADDSGGNDDSESNSDTNSDSSDESEGNADEVDETSEQENNLFGN